MKKNINLKNLPKKKKITIKRMRIKFERKKTHGDEIVKKKPKNNPKQNK
jgi:hypothetical protein